MVCPFYLVREGRCFLVPKPAWRGDNELLLKVLKTDNLDTHVQLYCESENHVRCHLYTLARACSILSEIQSRLLASIPSTESNKSTAIDEEESDRSNDTTDEQR